MPKASVNQTIINNQPTDRVGDKIGYARVSTFEQTLDLQIDALTKAGCVKIFTDTASGAKASRAGLEEAIKDLRRGDCLVVWKLDRLGRSHKDLIDKLELLKQRGVAFVSLTEQIDTSTAIGQFFFNIIGSMAQFERDLIIERTQAGLMAARARGRVGGRPKIMDENKQKILIQLYEDKNNTIDEICTILGFSRPTLFNYVRDLKKQGLIKGKNAVLNKNEQYMKGFIKVK